ncbi:BCD family MFS transporter [Adhaeretor mobilis]|uniref:Uncharacterized protein n=1 Tax=Adhaeretor mobilis TaxID=1930276 RepID=A0A517N2I5_9BACT|nr:BCD family MFS transporter [Adhaeretor mobilis]QDT01341.1 hypothetical protein HG15A2_46830 [Adhaeretor mobilis]
MSDIVTAIWGIALLVTLLGCIPYGIWIIYTAVKKRWKRLGLQIGIPIIAFGLLAGASAIVNAGADERYLEGLYDTEVDLGPPIFEYDSERAFNGDGYSISVYELPSSIRTRFEAADERLLSEYPKHPSYRDHWSFERWRRSPFDGKFQEYLDFALSTYDAGNASELTNHFEAIRSALKSEGSFYAFFYYRPSGCVGDVDFFIVDLVGGRLYSFNHNT